MDQKYLLFSEIFLSRIGGYPLPPLTENHPAQKPLAEIGGTHPPLNGKNPLSSFRQVPWQPMRSFSHNVTIEIFRLIRIISLRLYSSILLDKIVQFKVQIHFRYNCLAHIGKGKLSAGRGTKYVELDAKGGTNALADGTN